MSSFCAEAEILRTLNLAQGGPLPVISPTSTDAGLTRSDGLPVAAGGNRGEPGFYYPTGVRNFVRLLPGDDLLAVADAVLAKRLGLQSVYVRRRRLGFLEGTGRGPVPPRREEARLPIAGSATFDPAAASYAALADRIARSGARGRRRSAASPFEGGDRLLKALRARLGARAPIMAGFFFAPVPEVLKRAGRLLAASTWPRTTCRAPCFP